MPEQYPEHMKIHRTRRTLKSFVKPLLIRSLVATTCVLPLAELNPLQTDLTDGRPAAKLSVANSDRPSRVAKSATPVPLPNNPGNGRSNPVIARAPRSVSKYAAAPKPATAQTEHKAAKTVYFVGDSYAERAVQSGLVQRAKAAGVNLSVNRDVGRSILGGGQVKHQSGLEAIRADMSQVAGASKIIVGLGTNGGDTPENIHTVMRTIRAENRQAPVYWVNVGALGYTSNRRAAISEYNLENANLQAASKNADPHNRFHILNWCGVVFPHCEKQANGNHHSTIAATTARAGLLDSDGVHPSFTAGMTHFNSLILKAAASPLPEHNQDPGYY